MKKFIMIFAALAALYSCNPTPEPFEERFDDLEKVEESTIRGNVAVLGSVENAEYFVSHSQGQVDLDSARVIFVDNASFLSNAEALCKAYSNGKCIIVSNPEIESVRNQANINGWKGAIAATTGYLGFSRISNFALDKPSADNALIFTVAESGEESDDESNTELDVQLSDGSVDVDEYAGSYVNALVDWVNYVLNPRDYAGMQSTPSVSFEHVKTIPISLQFHKCWLSSPDKINGNYQVSAHYTYTPYFAIDGAGQMSDYYEVTATFTSHTGLVFKGNDKENKHGGIYVHYTGAFLKEFKVWSAVLGSNYQPEFLSSLTPIPQTAVGQSNYSDTHSWKIGGNVTGGIGSDNGSIASSTKKELKGTFSFEVGESSTVSYSLSDLAVTNQHANGTLPSDFKNLKFYDGNNPMTFPLTTGDYASWTFKCENLPGYGGDNGFDRDATYISSSTADFDTHWVWRVPGTQLGSNESVGYLCTVINPTLAVAKNGYCVAFKVCTFNLGNYGFATTLLAPNRVSFGTISVINNTTDDVLSDIVATSDKYEYASTGSFNPAKNWKRNVPTGTYSVTLSKIAPDGTETKYVSTKSVDIPMSTGEDDFITLNFPHDFIKQ